MPEPVSFLLIHILFSTKDRIPTINTAIRPARHACLATVARSIDYECFRVGGGSR